MVGVGEFVGTGVFDGVGVTVGGSVAPGVGVIVGGKGVSVGGGVAVAVGVFVGVGVGWPLSGTKTAVTVKFPLNVNEIMGLVSLGSSLQPAKM